MTTYLVLVAAVIIACVFFNKLSVKVGIPMLFAFILLGMAFGTDGIVKIPFENYSFAEQACSIALIFIMFFGGFGTNWNEARPVAVKALLLSTLGVVLTAGITGLFCFYVLKINLLESFLIGSIISSTDAASVFSILRSKKLGLKDNTASLLELESGSNDPSSYMLTMVMLLLMSGKVSTGKVAYMIFAQFAYGLFFGGIIAFLALQVLRRFKFAAAGFDMAFVIGVALLSFSLPSLFGGNGYLSVYIVGIILGNSEILNKRSLVHFFDGVTSLMQMLIFFLLGLLSFPSRIPQVFLPSFAIALFLTFIARPAAVFAMLIPTRCSLPQQLLVSFSGLRGAASIVFAIMAVNSGLNISVDVFHIVFCIVLLSIGFQGTLIPLVSKKLGMIDSNADVFKTFTDYSDEVDIQFLKFTISGTHPWIGKEIRNIELPPDTLLVLIIRDEKPLIPSGATVLCENDTAVLSALSFHDETAIRLVEHRIDSGSKWIEKTISEFSPGSEELVIMIKRGGSTVIPRGDTVILRDDILVINKIP